MAELTMRQGDLVGKISVVYQPEEGFEQEGTWYVAEASITAESDTKFASGPAVIEHGGKELPVIASVFVDTSADEEEEDDDDEWKTPACELEIRGSEGVRDLAVALGLL
jgi:hypothetical protein